MTLEGADGAGEIGVSRTCNNLPAESALGKPSGMRLIDLSCDSRPAWRMCSGFGRSGFRVKFITHPGVVSAEMGPERLQNRAPNEVGNSVQGLLEFTGLGYWEIK